MTAVACKDCSEGKHGACIRTALVEQADDVVQVECACWKQAHGAGEIETELLYQAQNRDHHFPVKGGPCVFCSIFQGNSKYTKCSLETQET